MTAAMGLNTSLIEEPKHKKRPERLPSTPSLELFACSSPSFAVIQALVALLARPTSTALRPSNSYAENLKRMSG